MTPEAAGRARESRAFWSGVVGMAAVMLCAMLLGRFIGEAFPPPPPAACPPALPVTRT